MHLDYVLTKDVSLEADACAPLALTRSNSYNIDRFTLIKMHRAIFDFASFAAKRPSKIEFIRLKRIFVNILYVLGAFFCVGLTCKP